MLSLLMRELPKEDMPSSPVDKLSQLAHDWRLRQKWHCAHRLYWWKDTTSLLPSNILRRCNLCHPFWGGMSRHMPQLARWCLRSYRNSRSFHSTESSNHIHVSRKNKLCSEWKEHYFIYIFFIQQLPLSIWKYTTQAWKNSASTYCTRGSEMMGRLEM